MKKIKLKESNIKKIKLRENDLVNIISKLINEQEWSNRGFAWFGRAHHEGDDVTLTLDLIHSETKSMTASKKMHQIKVVVGKDDIEKGYDEIKKKADDYSEKYQGSSEHRKKFRLPVPSLEDFTVYRSGEKEKLTEQRDIVQWTGEEKKQVMRQLDDIHIKISDMYTDWIELHP